MTLTPGADEWQLLPNAVLDQDQRQRDADQWAAQARAALAQQWADNARAEVAASAPGGGFDPSALATRAGPETATSPLPPTSEPSPPVPSPPAAPAPSPILDQSTLGTPDAPQPSRARANITDVSQFGQAGLSYDEALAACGPAAAARLASLYGNNIPLKDVLAVAKTTGWTSGGGMNGIQNEKRLLDALHIPASLDLNPDPSHIVSDAQGGNPVTISTPNHYFTVDGFNANTGQYHVGQSGLAFRGGSEWMTMDQIRRLGGGLNGALFVDAPTSPQPSVAALDQGQTDQYVYGSQPVTTSGATSAPPTPTTPSGFDGLVNQARQSVQDATSGVADAVMQAPAAVAQTFSQAVDAARQTVGYTPDQPVQIPGFGFDPSHMQATTAPGLDIPLKQDVRDLNQPAQPTVFDQAGQVITENQANPPLAGVVSTIGRELTPGSFTDQALTHFQLPNIVRLNALRAPVVPNITEPGHPFNVMADLQQKYGTSLPNDQMTPEDRKRAEDAMLFVGGMTGPVGPAGKGSDELAQLIGRYSAETRQGLENFVREQTAAARSPKDIGDTVLKWMHENPPPPQVEPLFPPTRFTPEGVEVPVNRQTGEPIAPPPARPPAPPVEPPLPPAGSSPQPTRSGTWIDSVLEPTRTLPTSVQPAIRDFAAVVGRDSRAAEVVAETARARAVPGAASEAADVARTVAETAARERLKTALNAAGIIPTETRTATGRVILSTDNPQVNGVLDNIQQGSAIRQNPLGRAVLDAMGTAKQTLFSLSNFHTMTEALVSLYSSPTTAGRYIRAFVQPNYYRAQRTGGMAQTFDDAAKAGVTGLQPRAYSADTEGWINNLFARRAVQGAVGGVGGAATGYVETKAAGGSEEDARRNALIYGATGAALGAVPIRGATASEHLTQALWERAVPIAKVTAWDSLRGRLGDQTAATVVNERFGGLNYAQMGRDPTLRDVTRMIALAPDWNESTVRQLSRVLFGKERGVGATREFVVKAAAGTALMTEALNYVVNGHFSNENQPGHEAQVQFPLKDGKYAWVGLAPGNLQAYMDLALREKATPGPKPAFDFATNRLSMPAQAAGEVADLVSSRKPVQPQDVVRLGERVAPIGVQQVARETGAGMSPLEAALTAALGLNLRIGKGTAPERQTTTRGPVRPAPARPPAKRP